MADVSVPEARERARSPEFRACVEACRERGYLQPWFADAMLALADELAKEEREVLERIAVRGDLHFAGLPVSDLHGMYSLIQEWHLAGGRPSLIEDWRKLEAMRQERDTAVVEAAALRQALERIIHWPYDVGHEPENDLRAIRDAAAAALAAAGGQQEPT